MFLIIPFLENLHFSKSYLERCLWCRNFHLQQNWRIELQGFRTGVNIWTREVPGRKWQWVLLDWIAVFQVLHYKCTLERNNWRITGEKQRSFIFCKLKIQNIVSVPKFSIMILEFYQSLLRKFKIRSEN